jgi:CHAT domain-containing protein
MANRMGNFNKGGRHKNIFSKSSGEIKDENPKLTAVLSGHGKNRAYLHRFKLREEATCICGKEDQTMDHILFNCIKTREQRDRLKRRINKPIKLQDNKQELITKHRKVYSEFVESIDFDQLQQDEQ